MIVFDEKNLKKSKVLNPNQAKHHINDQRLYTFFDQLALPDNIYTMTGAYVGIHIENMPHGLFKNVIQKIKPQILELIKHTLKFEHVELIELQPCCYFLTIANSEEYDIIKQFIHLKKVLNTQQLLYKTKPYTVDLRCSLYFTTPQEDAYTFYTMSLKHYIHTQNDDTFITTYDYSCLDLKCI